MITYNFKHIHPKLKNVIYKATEMSGSVFVEWADKNGRHMVEYSKGFAEFAIDVGDWVVID